ncbi:MAG: Uma2 family endonuclease [Hyphomicrobiaceae bacterium]
MNEHTRIPLRRQPTQGAEGLPRWCWTVDDLDRMVEVGLLDEADRVELVEGEIVPMSPKGNRHELVRDELHNLLEQRLARTVRISIELGWRPHAGAYHEPDLLLYAQGLKGPSLPPEQALLLIEVADSSLAYDLGRKAEIYAGLGVREYWVVEAHSLLTHVHRDAAGTDYTSVTKIAADAILQPRLLPAISLKLADLGLE